MVCLIGTIAEKLNIKHICFSGGVFQNELLVDWIKIEYANKYQLYFHINLSPNDENISFGQMVYHENCIKSKPLAANISSRKNTNEEQFNNFYDLAV